MRILKALGGIVAIIFVFHLMGKTDTNAIGTASTSSGCRISFAKFSQLQSGMSYHAVEEILGCPGREMSRSDIAGYSTVMLAWDGAGMFGANMNATFQNNSLISKAQFGLR
jgi:hypothetical protein